MDTLIVVLIIAVAVGFLAYHYWPGSKSSCGCGGCGSCSSCGTAVELDDLREKQDACDCSEGGSDREN